MKREVQAAFKTKVTQRCPACRDRSLIRTSEEQTPLVRLFYFQCLNTDCGQTWVSQLSVLHAIVPSAMPEPLHDVPPCPESWVRRRPPLPGEDPDQMTVFDWLESGRDEEPFQPPGNAQTGPQSLTA